MAANSALQKIQKEAKRIRRLHPSIEWKSAIKKASQQLKRQGKIGKIKVKKVGAVKFLEKGETKKSPVKKTYIGKIKTKTTVSKTISGTASSLALAQLNAQVRLLRDIERKKDIVKKMFIETRDKRKKAELRNEIISIEILKRTIKKNIAGLKARVK